MKTELQEKLKKIKLFLFDVDGILTDGKIIWDSSSEEFLRTYHIRDGYGLRLLIEAGYKVGIISGGNSNNVRKRFEMLGAHYLYLGHIDKRQSYLDAQKKAGVSDTETLYMGDELFDTPLLKKSGFSATVADTTDEIKSFVDYVTTKPGGHGAVREVIDYFRKAVDMKINIKDFD